MKNAQTKFQKMVAKIDARRAFEAMTPTEQLAYRRAKQMARSVVQRPVHPLDAIIRAEREAREAMLPKPTPPTCPQGGTHDYKIVATGRCYCKAICTKCGDVSEVDSSD